MLCPLQRREHRATVLSAQPPAPVDHAARRLTTANLTMSSLTVLGFALTVSLFGLGADHHAVPLFTLLAAWLLLTPLLSIAAFVKDPRPRDPLRSSLNGLILLGWCLALFLVCGFGLL